MGIGLYIHIPFCVRKCPYCDFYSVAFDEDSADRYAASICRAIKLAKPVKADTVYFGGGTPSVFGAKRILRILSAACKRFDFTSDAEVTVEANPPSGMPGGLRGLPHRGG
ncbi:MAG: radical SAM protein, partial [Oscillospiraceae bacterium]|nr:radical SAM protein [Oscillospiraceae bacterium]